MRVRFLNRKPNAKEKSIEKLFSYISSEIQSKGVEVENVCNPYDHGFLNMLKSIVFFRRWIRKTDIVHISGQIHFAAIGLKTNKIVITVHDLGLYRNLSYLRFSMFKVFWIYLPFYRAKSIVAISEKTKSEIIALMPSVANKVQVIPNCLTIDLREDNSLKENNVPIVLIVGARSNKNIERGIKALHGLDVKVIIVGELSDLQKKLLLECSIRYDNYCGIEESKLLELYKISDVLLFPSIYEGFGLPILEAQAQNVMVVTSDISPLKEIADNGAIFVSPYDVDDVRRGLVEALNLKPEERLALIKLGKENAKHYTGEAVADKYIEIYESI